MDLTVRGFARAGGQPLLRGRFARSRFPGWPPFAPARWGVGVGFGLVRHRGLRLLPVRGRGRAGGDSSLPVSATAWLRLLGRCGDTPGTPPSVRLAGASLRGGRVR
ncbi:hypothetical protein SCATT_21390 [Streptantibioticus cattleyicolor NRRL 8057 = DSM 46488]|uniref:Uncharacterized protein n=1 Tax=Streptantibioticus cattleyicolor (strain ATCC 35852 / DSM 46488 / JCM 4925 / NBRC 14057 / NRRL 8057) TaxID=1003195 RepID=G8X275_STREN|nr:hypothetical protein SCATT_21390 [Streptantibioticus cattleyicolor NRRL 8057 = DSM 46488]